MAESESITPPTEIWKPIAGWEKYEVSNCGRVRRIYSAAGHLITPPRVLIAYPIKTHYRGVLLSDKPRERKAFVHTLVLEAFVGPCPAGHECRHLNGQHADNVLENLAWGTHKQNYDDLKRHGRSRLRHGSIKGQALPARRITTAIAEQIKREYKPFVTTRPMLAKKYKLSLASIGLVLAGKLPLFP